MLHTRSFTPLTVFALAILAVSTATADPNSVDAHWAFRSIDRPEIPDAGESATTLTPIDGFIFERLNRAELAPNPPADPGTLIRRISFDVLGLPPAPEDVEAFASNDSPDAYESLVDRSLASPRHGERWARHWLDVARYADNKGYVFFENKEYPWAWTYRDYVVNSFNEDKPFARFVTEQIAADLARPEDQAAQAALGFLTVGGHFINNTHDIIDDRIDVVTRGLMGLTVSCARCHDHKFDPVSMAEYYSLYGVFRSCDEPMVPPTLGPTNADDGYDVELRSREKALVDFVTGKHAALVNGARTRSAEYLLAANAARDKPPADDFMLIADPDDLNPSMITRWRQFLTDSQERADPAWKHWHVAAELPEEGFAEAAVAAFANVADANPLVDAAFEEPPASMEDVAARYAKLLADVNRAEPFDDPNAEALRAVLYGPDSPADAPLALDWGFLSLFPDRATQDQYKKVLGALEAWLAKGPPRAMVLHDAERPFSPRVFERGQPSRPGVAVPRQFLRIACEEQRPFGPGSGRLELARAIVSPENPLTARVFVNRVWMHHFGSAIVGTPGDFGVRGDAPTHPELLDWLAAEFVDSDWFVKELHREILTSATYRQSSRNREDGQHADPENRLLWKMNRRRLEFEPLHDATLAVAGRLDATIGGPPERSIGEHHRRAIYGYVDRLEFPNLLTTFDVPNPAGCVPERTTTTVSPQALYLMNGPFAREAARALSQRIPENDGIDAAYAWLFARPPTDDDRRLVAAFLSREPTNERWVDLLHGLLMSNEFAFID